MITSFPINTNKMDTLVTILSTFCDHVTHVISVCPFPEVFFSNTTRIIAGV